MGFCEEFPIETNGIVSELSEKRSNEYPHGEFT